jgi:hypothetical protein
MDEEEWKEFLEQFGEEAIAPIARTLGTLVPVLRTAPLAKFKDVVREFQRTVDVLLATRTDAATAAGIPYGLREGAFVHLVERLNAALPDEFPYCLALVQHTKPDSSVFLTVEAFDRSRFAQRACAESSELPFVRIDTPDGGVPPTFTRN